MHIHIKQTSLEVQHCHILFLNIKFLLTLKKIILTNLKILLRRSFLLIVDH